MEMPGVVEQVFTIKDVKKFRTFTNNTLVKYLAIGNPLLLEAPPASCLQDLENLSIQRDDVKAVVTLYASLFESKVLIPPKGSGGKKMVELIPPPTRTLAAPAMQSEY